MVMSHLLVPRYFFISPFIFRPVLLLLAISITVSIITPYPGTFRLPTFCPVLATAWRSLSICFHLEGLICKPSNRPITSAPLPHWRPQWLRWRSVYGYDDGVGPFISSHIGGCGPLSSTVQCSQWTLIGLGARAVSMEGRACHLRRRACPGATGPGIGPTICETKELQHKYYDDREASPSGFAGAQILMVGMRWPVDFDWARGQSRLNGREGVPLETAGVPGSSRHRPDHLRDQRAATQILL